MITWTDEGAASLESNATSLNEPAGPSKAVTVSATTTPVAVHYPNDSAISEDVEAEDAIITHGDNDANASLTESVHVQQQQQQQQQPATVPVDDEYDWSMSHVGDNIANALLTQSLNVQQQQQQQLGQNYPIGPQVDCQKIEDETDSTADTISVTMSDSDDDDYEDDI